MTGIAPKEGETYVQYFARRGVSPELATDIAWWSQPIPDARGRFVAQMIASELSQAVGELPRNGDKA